MSQTNEDPSANTAKFRAFAQRADDNPPPWQMRAPVSRVAVFGGVVLVVAVVIAIIALSVAG